MPAPLNRGAATKPPLAPQRHPVHASRMTGEHHAAQREARTIRTVGGPGGSVTYDVDLPPEDLPSVCKRDLELAWYAARDAAIADRWDSVRAFRFNRPDGSHTDLALADRD